MNCYNMRIRKEYNKGHAPNVCIFKFTILHFINIDGIQYTYLHHDNIKLQKYMHYSILTSKFRTLELYHNIRSHELIMM